MSTSVNYKGNTITTISNATRTLNTAGTWLEANITITDTSSGGGIAIEDSNNATGVTCVITGSELPTIEPLNITVNGTYTASGSVGGYSPVTVNVSGGGSAPSATQHTIVFAFTDSTSTTITAYWDDSFITTAITATEPETYSSKTVATAALDGTTWYTRSTETWETIYDDNIQWIPDDNNDYPYCWVSSLSDVSIADGSVWRVTYDNATYRCTGASGEIGNPKWSNGTDDGSNVPFNFANHGWGAWTGGLNVSNTAAMYYFKIERLVTS